MKNLNCQWSWYLVTVLVQICKIQWWCSLSSVFYQKYLKIQNCLFKLKLVSWLISNTQNPTVMFNFFVFDWKYPFWANLFEKIKIVSLSWKLVSRLNRIRRRQWWCLLLLFWTGNTIFGQIWPKKIKIIGYC